MAETTGGYILYANAVDLDERIFDIMHQELSFLLETPNDVSNLS